MDTRYRSPTSGADGRGQKDPVIVNRRHVLAAATAVAAAGTGPSAVAADNLPDAGYGAPIAELHFPAGALTLEQKEEMIKGVTDVLIRAVKLPPDQAPRLWVELFETAEGGWGAGGKVFVPRKK